MRRRQLGLLGALLTGLLLVGLYPPWNLSLLAPLALTPLVFVLAYEPSPKYRFLWGWIAGTIFWGVTCYWIRDVLNIYGGLNGSLSWLAQTLFAMAKGLLLGLFAVGAGYVLTRPWAIPAVAALWVGVERLNEPQGFAWLTLGNAGIGMGVPLRLAPWTGVYGLSFVFAALATALALVALRRPRKHLLWLAPLLGLALLPAIDLKTPPNQQAVVLQPAIPMEFRWTEAEAKRAIRQLSLKTLEEALDPRKTPPALLAWPEVPAPFYYYADPVFRDHVTEVARLSNAPFVFGTVAHTTDARPLNSAVFLARDGKPAGRYDKIKLVPFGEFVPPLFGWIEKISSEAGMYQSGDRVVAFTDGQHAVGTFICYESAFPNLVRQFAAQGAQVLVNLTNDGYFGRSAAREQHLQLARMRAVENQRWLLRVTNDGTTTAIDPTGRPLDVVKRFEETTARLRFGWLTEKTLYTRWGDWFAWSCLLLGAAAAAMVRFNYVL